MRTGKVTLDRAQQIGLDCYDDIQEEIPRDEVESIGQLVIEAFHSISSVPGEGSIMGSYRRGKASSGDVDILITMKDYPDFIPRCALPDLIRFLTEQGHIAQHITFFPGIPPANASDSTGEESLLRKRSESRKSGFTKSCKSYMGVFFSSKFPGKQRRVDIKIYPYNQKAFASLCKYLCTRPHTMAENTSCSFNEKTSQVENGSIAPCDCGPPRNSTGSSPTRVSLKLVVGHPW